MAEVIFAPDGMSLEGAVALCRSIKGSQYGNSLDIIKIHDLHDRHGPAAIQPFAELGFRPWVDAKLHDTPDTVRLRTRALKNAGASIVTVHASGGVTIMKAAKESGLIIYGITVLTSLKDDESYDGVRKIFSNTAYGQVLSLTYLTLEAGLDGVVCSALEARPVAGFLSPLMRGRFHIAVPGTRSVGVKLGSQKRSATPGEAVASGATHLVVASEVVGADDPVEAFGNFVRQVDEAQD